MPRRKSVLKRSLDPAKSPAGMAGAVTAQPPVSNRLTVDAIVKSALLLAVIFWIVIPATPFPLGPGLDSSWAIGLNLGHFDKMMFGRDIVFTYGPLGYLVVPTFPEAEPWAVFTFAWGFAIVTAYALWMLSKYARHWTETCLYLGVFWIYSGFTFDAAVERMLGAIVALTLLIAARSDARQWFHLGLLFFLAAVALLTKFNIGVIGSVVAFYLAGFLIWRHRFAWRMVAERAVAALLVWPFTLVGLYWLLEGTPRGLAGFFSNSIQIANGYSEAMALPGPIRVENGAIVIVLALLLCLPLAAGDIRRLVWGIPPLMIVGFLCFKAAMVREDTHALPFPFQMAALALLMVALASTSRSRIVVGVFALASLDWGAVTVTEMWPQFLPTYMGRLTGLAAVKNLNGFLHWQTTVDGLEAATQQALTKDQLPAEFLPYVTGKRVSTYPWEIAIVKASHLQWQPLPVFQWYSAYTPALDRLNAQKLEDASGPEAILLAWNSIDGRHPFYETPQSWRALLNWYDLQLTSPKLYLLHRRSIPRFDPPVSTGEEVLAHWDEGIALPPVADDEAVVMDADIRENFKGILKRTLLRSPIVTVQIRLRSGITMANRVVPSNLKDGVWASDYPMGLDDLAPMFKEGRPFSGDRVASISFCTPTPTEFDPMIRIRWSRVTLRQPNARGELLTPTEQKVDSNSTRVLTKLMRRSNALTVLWNAW